MRREPFAVKAFFKDLNTTKGMDKRQDDLITNLQSEISNQEGIEMRARAIVDKMAVAFQASLLLRQNNPAIAEAFISTRLACQSWNYGAMVGSNKVPLATQKFIIDRLMPQ
jgi:putative acyl-CoA dehydrogenase